MSDLSVSTELVRVLYCSFSSSVSLLSSKSLSLSPPLPFKISASSCACFDVSCAKELGKSESSVKVALHRLRKDLKKLLESEGVLV